MSISANWTSVIAWILSLFIAWLALHYGPTEVATFECTFVTLAVVQLLILTNVRSSAGATQLMISTTLLFAAGYRTYQLGSLQVTEWWFFLSGLVGVMLFLTGLNSIAAWRLDERLGQRYNPKHPELWH